MVLIATACGAATDSTETTDPAEDIAAFCRVLLEGSEATIVGDGMTAAEVTLTMRNASIHFASAAAIAPDDIRNRVQQIAENYDVVASAMEEGEAPIEVLLSPPLEVDQSAVDDVARYVDRECR